MIAGTPAANAAGTYPITITATSSSGEATARLTLTITPRQPVTPMAAGSIDRRPRAGYRSGLAAADVDDLYHPRTGAGAVQPSAGHA